MPGSAQTLESIQPGSRSTGVSKVFPQTDSSARKFVSMDQVELWPSLPSISNSEHIANVATGLRALALAVDALVKNAIEQTEAARKSMATVIPEKK